MSAKPYLAPEPVQAYIESISLREPDILRRLREETASHPRAIMQIPPEQGQLFGLLTKLMNVKKALEIGVFTGYSSLSVALALPPEGRLIGCDVSEEFAQMARRYWKEAAVDGKIDLRIGPALDTLKTLREEGQTGTFDFAFIDADKPNYDGYYEECLRLVRSGGLIALDNMLQHGRVIEAQEQDDNVKAIRALNEKIHRDERVDLAFLGVADGITLARVR